ncbi:hypothetical protein E2C01_097944 [Portunus trituberculatus]|uniref:Uncharacterized protein n=1 Tax=Portunus trituberculatus TaxID=210409 RepID=A0A5B7K734_PORTR|nr:hypothetical protein [Portunus trituberculatus]
MQEGSRAAGQGRDGMGLGAGSRRVVDGTRDRDGRSRQREMNQSSLMPCPVLRNVLLSHHNYFQRSLTEIPRLVLL